MTAAARPRRRWLRRLLIGGALLVAVLLALFTAAGGWGLLSAMKKPDAPFDPREAPPAPDYARAGAWLAFPGRNGPERSTPPGFIPVDEARAPADVFFVHPTTFRGNAVWLAPFDAPDAAAPLYPPVLLGQASVFNGCCRIYAPRYRQASLAGLGVPAAMDIAYGDIARAFRHYLAHGNKGRPFILASHSQGTAHAIRLVQEEVLGKPQARRMVAAFFIGGYTPDTFPQLGLPVCDDARQTGCVLSYNAAETGRRSARLVIDDKSYWWRGRLKTSGQARALCVNPLTWRRSGVAAADTNGGSLPFPTAPFPAAASHLPALTPQLTGAACHDGMLDVDVPWGAPAGFGGGLVMLLGSHHLNDYGLFYAALRRNAVARVAAWQAASAAGTRP